MKRKQKRIMVIVLGVAALALCGLQLGPIFLGGKIANPGAKPKAAGAEGGAAAAPAGGAAAKKPPAGSTAKNAPARPKPANTQGPKAAAAQEGDILTLEAVVIDLGNISRRDMDYRMTGARNPFAAALFEAKRVESPLPSLKVKLQGVIVSAEHRLAIIDNRVYGEGDEIASGVTVRKVDGDSVTLTDGKTDLRLCVANPGMKLGKN